MAKLYPPIKLLPKKFPWITLDSLPNFKNGKSNDVGEEHNDSCEIFHT